MIQKNEIVNHHLIFSLTFQLNLFFKIIERTLVNTLNKKLFIILK